MAGASGSGVGVYTSRFGRPNLNNMICDHGNQGALLGLVDGVNLIWRRPRGEGGCRGGNQGPAGPAWPPNEARESGPPPPVSAIR